MELKIALTLNDNSEAANVASHLGGALYSDEREDTSRLPFTALVTGVTDDVQQFADSAVEGVYVVAERIIKPGVAKVFSLSPMVGNPDLSHAQSDAHWRDTHAPLALKHHAYMTEYVQLSILHCIRGRALDGFALCGFETVEDLKTRFFSEPDSYEVIMDDIPKFADTAKSPRPLIATPHRF
ncbi:MAG: hypothetical protein AAF513_16590 [Pseudomonadota bacterium]